MASEQLHIAGSLGPVSLDGYRFCFDSQWSPEANRRVDSVERFLASGVEENDWRLDLDGVTVDVSQWETPKRTRTYPLPRMYQLLQSAHRKAALIPAVKDEGSGLNPDVLGLDTIHLLTQFGLYVVVGRYVEGRGDERSKRGTNETVKVLRDQRLDFRAALHKLRAVAAPEVDVREWNGSEVELFGVSLARSAEAYRRLQERTGVPLTTIASCERRLTVLREGGLPAYVDYSDRFRKRSQHAETVSVQPKEHLIQAASKVLVDIRLECDLGAGADVWLHLAPDEGWAVGRHLLVLEKKSNPSQNDTLDAIFKNLVFRSMKVENAAQPVHFGIGSTYSARTGACWSLCPHFADCSREGFADCRFAPLAQRNEAATIFARKDVVAFLCEGAANGFLAFVIGLRGLAEEEEAGVQTAILEGAAPGRLRSL